MTAVLYLAAAVAFIVGLKRLGSPGTARSGNRIAAIGMLAAVVITLITEDIVNWGTVLAGLAVGTILGVWAAVRVQMTAMPQMVALLNGFGGAASALVASAELLTYWRTGTPPTGIVSVAIVLGVLIGGLTFTGSLVAFAKLQELISGRPTVFPLQHLLNLVLVLAAAAMGVYTVVWDPTNLDALLVIAALGAMVLGKRQANEDVTDRPAVDEEVEPEAGEPPAELVTAGEEEAS